MGGPTTAHHPPGADRIRYRGRGAICAGRGDPAARRAGMAGNSPSGECSAFAHGLAGALALIATCSRGETAVAGMSSDVPTRVVQFEAVMDALPVGVAIIDAEMRVVLINPAYCASVGLP